MTTQANFVEGDTGKSYPLFLEWTPWINFGYGNWLDTPKNREIIAKILEQKRKTHSWIEQRQAETRGFIINLLKDIK